MKKVAVLQDLCTLRSYMMTRKQIQTNLSSEYFSRQILFLFGRYRGRNGGHGTAAARGRGRGAGRGAAAAEDAAPQPWPGGGLKKIELFDSSDVSTVFVNLRAFSIIFERFGPFSNVFGRFRAFRMSGLWAGKSTANPD